MLRKTVLALFAVAAIVAVADWAAVWQRFFRIWSGRSGAARCGGLQQ